MSKSRAATQHGLIPLEIIERRIYFIRTHKVMLDSDLAELYGVTTKRLNEQVKRNIDRFPTDFMTVCPRGWEGEGVVIPENRRSVRERRSIDGAAAWIVSGWSAIRSAPG